MVLFLPIDIPQHAIDLTQAYRKCTLSVLPCERAITRIKRFDPFRGRLLDLLDELSLGKRAWQGRNNVNVIGNTADMHEFSAHIAADCCEISMHAWLHVCIEPGFTVFCGEDDVNDNFTEGLRHADDDVLNRCWSESRFQRLCF